MLTYLVCDLEPRKDSIVIYQGVWINNFNNPRDIHYLVVHIIPNDDKKTTEHSETIIRANLAPVGFSYLRTVCIPFGVTVGV